MKVKDWQKEFSVNLKPLTIMPHSYNEIWIHAIWSTKERFPLLHPSIENEVYQYISEELRLLGCPVRIINGMPDHIHCLFLLNPQKSIADIVKQIKGSSSHHINQNDLIAEKFAWQTGYASFSISKSDVDTVFHYIRNQKIHHQQKTYEQEYEELAPISTPPL